MTKIKRISAFILAVIMMLNLAACADNKSDVNDGVQEQTAGGVIRENKVDNSKNSTQNIQQVVPATQNTTSSNKQNETKSSNSKPTTSKPSTSSEPAEEKNVDTKSKDVNTINNKTSAIEVECFDTDAFIASMPTKLNGSTITFLNWYDTDDRAAEKENIEAFEKATGINVNVIGTEYNMYTDKLVSMVATGDAPDVIRMSEPRAAWMKYLQPIVNTGYDFEDKNWNKEVEKLYSVNGIQYAANLSYTPFIVFSTIQYYTDAIEEYGFEDPWELWKKGEWTWEKMNSMSEEWIKQGPDYYGFANVNFEMYTSTLGLDFVNYDGNQWNMNLYDGTLLRAWRDLIRDRENRITVQSTNSTFGKVKHTAFFAYCDSTCLEASSIYNVAMKNRGVWGVVPTPKHAGKEYYAPLTELLAFGVPTGAKNPEAVPYFISWYANLAKYDPDTFFYNEQAKAVFEDMVSQPNRHLAISNRMFDFDVNPFVWNLYNNATSSQVSTFIQSQEYKCWEKLREWNDVLYNMNAEIK